MTTIVRVLVMRGVFVFVMDRVPASCFVIVVRESEVVSVAVILLSLSRMVLEPEMTGDAVGFSVAVCDTFTDLERVVFLVSVTD